MRDTLLLAVAVFTFVCCDETRGDWKADRAAQSGCRVVKLDEPLNGRMLKVCSPEVEVVVAPQQGGRLMGLRAGGGPEMLRSDADYTQANDRLGMTLGGRRRDVALVDAPAEAEILSDSPALAAVEWKTDYRSGAASLSVRRRVAVRRGTSAVFFEAAVINRGSSPLLAVTYQMQLRLLLSDDIRCEAAGETFGEQKLKDYGFQRSLAAGATCRIGRQSVCLTVRPQAPATLGLGGLQYMFRLDHTTPSQDIAPGGELKLRVVWQLGPRQAPATKPPAFDWSSLPGQGQKVEPFVVRDTPPDDLPRTPLTERSGYYALNVNSGSSLMPLWAVAGVRWVRANQFAWRMVEPRPGQFDFSAADATVDAADRMGMQTFGVIHQSPVWAARHGRASDPPKDFAAWGRYIETVVRRYRDRVHIWEIWNEPDIDEFWTGSAEQYVTLLRTAYAAAKRADPHCLVMSAGPDGSGEDFLQRIVRLGAADYCDLVGFHPYGNLPDGPQRRMRAVWRILNHYHVKKPVWATEIGWQAGGWPAGSCNVGSEQSKARCLTEGLPSLRPWAEVACWYVDIEPNHVYGLAEPQGTEGFELNPAYFAFQRASGAGQRPLPLRVELPGTVRLPVGKTSVVCGKIRNTGGRPLMPTAAAVGMAAEQLKIGMRSAALAAGQSREIELTVAPASYQPGGKLLDLLAFFAEKQLVGSAWLTLDVQGDGPRRDFTLVDQWAQPIDVHGKEIGPARPRDQLALRPGEAFRQGLKLENSGATDETLAVTLEGPAAAWVAAIKEREVRVPAGKKGWISLEVRIPTGVSAGTHDLKVVVASRGCPDLRRQCLVDVNVAAR
jgi:hypothetical protein